MVSNVMIRPNFYATAMQNTSANVPVSPRIQSKPRIQANYRPPPKIDYTVYNPPKSRPTPKPIDPRPARGIPTRGR